MENHKLIRNKIQNIAKVFDNQEKEIFTIMNLIL